MWLYIYKRLQLIKELSRYIVLRAIKVLEYVKVGGNFTLKFFFSFFLFFPLFFWFEVKLQRSKACFSWNFIH